MSLPTHTELKAITRIYNFLEKQGASILIMAIFSWIFYSMMIQTQKDIKECNDYTRNVLTKVVEHNTITMEKMVTSMERLENKK